MTDEARETMLAEARGALAGFGVELTRPQLDEIVSYLGRISSMLGRDIILDMGPAGISADFERGLLQVLEYVGEEWREELDDEINSLLN